MPDAPHLFRTDRFVASRIRADDLQDFQSFYADPAVMSTMSADGRVWPATESSDLFDRHLAHWEEHGFGTWVFRDPENGAFVARAGLCSLDIGSGPVVELFYGVASGLWGRGVATEIGREVIRIAFRDLRAEFLVGFTLPTNLASRRVLEKCSFYRDGEIEHAFWATSPAATAAPRFPDDSARFSLLWELVPGLRVTWDDARRAEAARRDPDWQRALEMLALHSERIRHESGDDLA